MATRNPEIQVISTDANEIRAEWVSRLEKKLGIRIYPASDIALLIDGIVEGIVHERVLINYAINQCIPSRADGSNLDGLAEVYFIQERRKAIPARCTMHFTISQAQKSAILIPGGTRITDQDRTLYWETEQDNYILPGSTEIDLPVVCQTAGADGNGWPEGSINALVDIFDYYVSCSNTTKTDGGSDAMDDDEFYEAMRLSMGAWTVAGPEGAYVYYAKTVSSEIADVAACTSAPGVATIFAIGEDGRPVSKELQDRILEACSAGDTRPMTDLVKMAEPVDVPYNVKLTYYLPRSNTRNSAAIQAAVSSAVAEYTKWQSARLGRDINPSKLIEMIMQAGVKRVDVQEPVFKALEEGKSFDAETEAEFRPPELAKLGTVSVTNGGFEDE